jgi:hypothetical protein
MSVYRRLHVILSLSKGASSCEQSDGADGSGEAATNENDHGRCLPEAKRIGENLDAPRGYPSATPVLILK